MEQLITRTEEIITGTNFSPNAQSAFGNSLISFISMTEL
jgi:hypothetical protein